MSLPSHWKLGVPVEGSLWERDDEVFRVEKVYEAQRRRKHAEGFEPCTLVKLICVEPMPRSCSIEGFERFYSPYDPDAA